MQTAIIWDHYIISNFLHCDSNDTLRLPAPHSAAAELECSWFEAFCCSRRSYVTAQSKELIWLFGGLLGFP